MSFHYDRTTLDFVRSRPTVECAQCRERLFMPEWTEYVDEHRVRYIWECDDCGYAFETTVFYGKTAA